MKISSLFLALPIVSVGLILALSMGAFIPETWLWILILGLGLSSLLAVSTGFSLNFISDGTDASRTRRFFPGLLPAKDDPVETETAPIDSSPETDCTVWDGF